MEFTLLTQTGETLCGRCRLADTPASRVKGLMGKRRLDADEGILLATWAIHTSFMRFPIDVAFLDRNFVVLKTVRNLTPWKLAAERRAHAVVELASGALDRAGLERGDQLSLVKHGDPAEDPETANGHDGGRFPLRVALASQDSRFLRVARFLLDRHAFEVETFRDTRALLADGAVEIDVVVLDSSTSLTVTARVMRELSVANPSTGFVIVGDSFGSENGNSEAAVTQSVRVLPKWDSFDRLVDEIHAASRAREVVH